MSIANLDCFIANFTGMPIELFSADGDSGDDTTDGRRKHATYKGVISLHGRAKGGHAKTRQMVILAGFRMATFRPARQRYDKQ